MWILQQEGPLREGLHQTTTRPEKATTRFDGQESRHCPNFKSRSERLGSFLPVLVHAKKNAKLTAFPDTGADINILPVRFLPKLGINKNYLKPPDVTITAYNGERDSPIGFFEAKLTVEESSTLAKIDICAAKNTAIPTRRQDERTIGNCHVPTTHGTSRH